MDSVEEYGSVVKEPQFIQVLNGRKTVMPLSAALNLKLSLGNMKIKRGLLFMNQVRHFL